MHACQLFGTNQCYSTVFHIHTGSVYINHTHIVCFVTIYTNHISAGKPRKVYGFTPEYVLNRLMVGTTDQAKNARLYFQCKERECKQLEENRNQLLRTGTTVFASPDPASKAVMEVDMCQSSSTLHQPGRSAQIVYYDTRASLLQWGDIKLMPPSEFEKYKNQIALWKEERDYQERKEQRELKMRELQFEETKVAARVEEAKMIHEIQMKVGKRRNEPSMTKEVLQTIWSERVGECMEILCQGRRCPRKINPVNCYVVPKNHGISDRKELLRSCNTDLVCAGCAKSHATKFKYRFKGDRVMLWLRDHDFTYRGQCALCDEKFSFLDNWHAAHVVPDSSNGANTIENKRTTCCNCNTNMGSRNMNDYASIKQVQIKPPKRPDTTHVSQLYKYATGKVKAFPQFESQLRQVVKKRPRDE